MAESDSSGRRNLMESNCDFFNLELTPTAEDGIVGDSEPMTTPQPPNQEESDSFSYRSLMAMPENAIIGNTTLATTAHLQYRIFGQDSDGKITKQELSFFLDKAFFLYKALLEDISLTLAIGYHEREGREIGDGSGRPGGNTQPLVEDHVVVPVDSSGFSLETAARRLRRNTSPGHVSTSIDMGRHQMSTEAANANARVDVEAARVSGSAPEMLLPTKEYHMLIKVYFKLAVLMLGLSSTALFGLLSANLGEKTQETRLLLKLISIILVTVQLCSMTMPLLILIGRCRTHHRLLTILRVIYITASLLFIVSTVLALILILDTTV